MQKEQKKGGGEERGGREESFDLLKNVLFQLLSV